MFQEKTTRLNLVFIAVLPFLLLVRADAGESAPAPSCSYYQARASYLLGCCGDLEGDYPGPRFPGSLSHGERARFALNEIETAYRKQCADRHSPEFLSLALDKVGAYILLAQALTSEVPAKEGRKPTYIEAAQKADLAATALTNFVSEHQPEACRVAPWIAEAYLRAGRQWQAVAFVSTQRPECFREGARFIGDVLFDLGVLDAASRAYSNWLGGEGPSLVCDAERKSLSNAEELRQRGFDIPKFSIPLQEPCETLPWMPYVFLRPALASP